MGWRGNKKIFVLFLLIIILNFTSSSDVQSLGQIRQGDTILLKQNCVNLTYANITSISVHGAQTLDLIATSISMNLISDGYQTYSFSNSSTVGQYIVTGICDENGILKAWSYDYYVTPTGSSLNGVGTSVYAFFLFLCILITYFSVKLIKENRMADDKVTDQQLYKMQQTKEFSFYIQILKRKLWIVGVFGIYLSILILIGILNQISYNVNLTDLTLIFSNLFLILAWGLIPFVIFWLAYLIIYFYKSTENILKYQFGNIAFDRRSR